MQQRFHVAHLQQCSTDGPRRELMKGTSIGSICTLPPGCTTLLCCARRTQRLSIYKAVAAQVDNPSCQLPRYHLVLPSDVLVLASRRILHLHSSFQTIQTELGVHFVGIQVEEHHHRQPDQAPTPMIIGGNSSKVSPISLCRPLSSSSFSSFQLIILP